MRPWRQAELPAGATVAVCAAWQGRLEFVTSVHGPNAAHGRIANGTLAAPTVLDGIPVRAGREADRMDRL
jgi:hypothetical protein